MCDRSLVFKDFDLKKEINSLVNRLNVSGNEFINYYFDLLKEADLTKEEELTLIDFAINIIKADDLIEYSEIKFFKVIRHNLKISDEQILKLYNDIGSWLEDDISTELNLDEIKKQYLDIADLPQYDLISTIDLEQEGNN